MKYYFWVKDSIGKADGKAVAVCRRNNMLYKQYAFINTINIISDRAVNDLYIKLVYHI